MKKRILVTAIVIFLIVAVRILARFTGLVEGIYVENIYKKVVPILSRATGVFPFSLAEILIILLVLWLVSGLIAGVGRKGRKTTNGPLTGVLTLITVVGLLYLAFMGLWGLNYYRLGFAEMAGLDTSNVTTEELQGLGQSLVDQANQLRSELEEDDDGVMRLGNRQAVLDQAVAGYDVLAARYPQLGGQYGRPKGLTLSAVISYTVCMASIPFTGEANINTSIPDALLRSAPVMRWHTSGDCSRG